MIVFVTNDNNNNNNNQTSSSGAKNALQKLVRSLPLGSLFQIVSFGSHSDSVFAHSSPYDEQTFSVASAAVAAMNADMGKHHHQKSIHTHAYPHRRVY